MHIKYPRVQNTNTETRAQNTGMSLSACCRCVICWFVFIRKVVCVCVGLCVECVCMWSFYTRSHSRCQCLWTLLFPHLSTPGKMCIYTTWGGFSKSCLGRCSGRVRTLFVSCLPTHHHTQIYACCAVRVCWVVAGYVSMSSCDGVKNRVMSLICYMSDLIWMLCGCSWASWRAHTGWKWIGWCWFWTVFLWAVVG